MAETPEVSAGIVIPFRELSVDALRGLIESFVLREGTEYGAQDVRLEIKVGHVMRQLEKAEARIIFDPGTESIDIEVVRGGRGRSQG